MTTPLSSLPWLPLLFALASFLLPLADVARADDESGEAPPVRWAADTPVGRVVAERPETARLFELVGIDYCCGGKQTLAEAAAEEGLDVKRLLAALEAVGAAPGAPAERSWVDAPLAEVIDHVVTTHHAFLRRELPRLDGLVRKVARVHGANHAELADVERNFLALRAALEAHLRLEEEQVFPGVRRREAGEQPEGLDEHLATLTADHDEAGDALKTLRRLTAGYRVPEDACPTYRQMLAGLLALEQDLHRHVHLENEVLIPRARR